jgi:hypothetical protein
MSLEKLIIKETTMLKRSIIIAILAFGVGISMHGRSHAVIIEDSLMVTDVTPVQFCAVWETSVPAFGWLNVYLDSQATVPCTEAVITSESALHPPAEDIGVMKVKVTGLKPETEYFFQAESIVKEDNTVYLSPLTRVRTEKESTIVRNDVLVHRVSVPQSKQVLGMLVIASVDRASHPVSGWVGHGVPDGWGAIDANNFYDRQTHLNLELVGGEYITFMIYGGSLGFVKTQKAVPEETGGMHALGAVDNLPAPSVDPDSEPTVSPPPYSPGANGGGSTSCFIAAAASASPIGFGGNILKIFRDE